MTEKNDLKFDFAVGGQAVIEGVMMRSPAFITVSVRNEKGDIKSKEDPYLSVTKRLKFLGLPFIRGIIGLFEMMFIGIKALNFSASIFAGEENFETRSKKQKITDGILLGVSFVIAIGLSIFLFKFVPLWITEFLSSVYTPIKNSFLYNLIDGILKTSFFILYIALLNLMPSIKRVFEYHGAEHKSIFTYENGLPLTVDNAKKQTRFHPRCGTSFILIVFMLSILMYTLLPRDPDFMTSFLQRLALLPVIAAVSYEFLKLSAKHIDNKWMKLAVWPGLKFQLLTTREPDEKQLEVALHSLSRAIQLEGQKQNVI